MPPFYEVHPNDKGQWILYRTGDGDFLVVATFHKKDDAQRALGLFERDEKEVEAIKEQFSRLPGLAVHHDVPYGNQWYSFTKTIPPATISGYDHQLDD